MFLNFNLQIGNSSLGLIPNFLGYFFMFKGLGEMVPYSDYFYKMLPYVKGMGIYSTIIYMMDLSGASALLPMILNLFLGLILIVMSLYIAYNIIMGIRDIEMGKSLNLNCDQLYFAWRLLVVFLPLPSLTALILPLQELATMAMFMGAFPLLGFILIIANFGVGVYIYAFYNTKTLFYSNNPT